MVLGDFVLRYLLQLCAVVALVQTVTAGYSQF